VTGSGEERTLTWNVVRLPGQRVVFYEEGADAANVIAVSDRARGSVKFRPAAGEAGTRRLRATVEQDGVPRKTIDLGGFAQAGPTGPPAPKGLKLQRRGGRVVVTWQSSARAKRYEVRATVSDGRRLLVRTTAAKRTASFRVRPRDRVVVTVTPVSAENVRGTAARKTLAARARAAVLVGTAERPVVPVGRS
jgi:hypothetical protein